MPELTINLKLRKDSTKELTFEEVDGNFLSLKSAITELNDNLQSYSLTSHTHEGLSPMLGMVAHFALPKAPEGWLVCDGSAVSRTQYSKLFAAMGVIFGVGDGVNTFNLPDLRGEFIRGWDGGRGADKGREFGKWQRGSIQPVDPGINSPGLASALSSTNPSDNSVQGRKAQLAGVALDVVDETLYKDVAFAAAGAQLYSNDLFYSGWCVGGIRPRNVALLPCIKY